MDCISRPGKFTETSDPVDDLIPWLRYNINEILEKDDNCLNCCKGEMTFLDNKTKLLITIVKGNLALRSSMNKEIKEKFKVSEIVWAVGDGTTITILDELDSDTIYLRIRSFYEEMLRKEGDMDPKKVKKSEDYIRRLSGKPSWERKIDLCSEVLTGILEYAYSYKDSYGVTMGDYAKQLQKQQVVG